MEAAGLGTRNNRHTANRAREMLARLPSFLPSYLDVLMITSGSCTLPPEWYHVLLATPSNLAVAAQTRIPVPHPSPLGALRAFQIGQNMQARNPGS